MKRIKKILILTIIILTFMVQQGFAQATSPQDPNGNPEAGTPIGGGAPIGNGVYVLLILGTTYGIIKFYSYCGNTRTEEL